MREPDPWLNVGDPHELPVRTQVSVGGAWMDINDGRKYTLELSTLGDRSATFRRKEISSPHLDGTWLVSATAENITENVSIWVKEFDHFALQLALEELRKAFTQPYYAMRWQVDVHEFAWNCQLADYSITTSRDMMHATIAQFTAKVPRHPESFHLQGGLLPRMKRDL